jgi:hypothetical protein
VAYLISMHPHKSRTLARGLGWFSLALGAAEMIAPRALARWLGMEGSEPMLRAYGMREVATGVGILASEQPAAWIWGRAIGDVLDLATLSKGLDTSNTRNANVGLAITAVAGVLALDVACAQSLTTDTGVNDDEQRRNLIHCYAGRSGFPRPAHAMRGAARDFDVPRDLRTPELLRPLV